MFFDGDCWLGGGAVYLPSIDVLCAATTMDLWIKLARETHVIEYGLVQSPEAETLVGLVGFTLLHR